MVVLPPAPSTTASRASSTKTRIETSKITNHSCHMWGIKSKFHENKDWNLFHPYQSVREQLDIKSKFHENKDWNSKCILYGACDPSIKSKFHENKDWNNNIIFCTKLYFIHQEQVPRKQGLKLFIINGILCICYHQEQVPRKQGLKHSTNQTIKKGCKASRASSTKTRIETHIDRGSKMHALIIKSKFHENKDWNYYYSS